MICSALPQCSSAPRPNCSLAIRHRSRIAIVAVNPHKHRFSTHSLHLIVLNAALAHALAIAARPTQLSKFRRIANRSNATVLNDFMSSGLRAAANHRAVAVTLERQRTPRGRRTALGRSMTR